MAKRILAHINPDLLRWARETAGLTIEAAEKRLKLHIADMEAGTHQVSIAQLRKIAVAYKRPLAAFFLPAAPIVPSPIHDFRRDGDLAAEDSPALALELRKARRRRAVAEELLTEFDRRAGTFSLSAELGEPHDRVASRAREWLAVEVAQQSSWRGEYDALSGWLGALEGRGVLVFQTGKVPLKVMRGLSVATKVLPYVLLNGKDRPRARVFTLMHELTHLMLHEGGVCDPLRVGPHLSPPNATVETFCNQVAGAILVPTQDLESAIAAARVREWSDDSIRSMADRFAVSREVIVIRLRGLDHVSEPFVASKLAEYRREYAELAARVAERQKAGTKTFGIPPFRIALRDNGRPFTRLVFEALERDRITLADASDYLGLKVKHFERTSEAIFDAEELV